MPEIITYDEKSTLEFSQGTEESAEFHHLLYLLNEISIELSKTNSLSELYQQAITLANQKLGFGRIAVLLFNNKKQSMSGTWGIGLDGELRDERDFSAPLEDDIRDAIEAISTKGKVCVWKHRELQEFGDKVNSIENVGNGWNAAIAFWEDDQVIGWVACDNLLDNIPFKPYQSHILRLFGTLIGELILRKRSEEKVFNLNNHLEEQIQQRTQELRISQQQLLDSHQALEEKVSQRTHDLESEKEKLQNTLDKLLSTESSLLEAQKQQFLLNENIDRLTEMQKELRSANLRAEAADITKSNFINNITHELNTPMNAIRGNHHLLSNTELNAPQQRFLQQANSATDKLTKLLADLLNFSHTEKKVALVNIKQHSLDTLLEEVFAVISPHIKHHLLTVISSVTRNVPDYIYCDADKLKEVLINLLSNACKFTKKGSVQLKIDTLIDDNQQVNLKIIVKDTGIGIAPDKLKQLFSSFSQGDDSASRHYGGTGLGLSLTHHYCQLMGATINVESQLGIGTRCSMTLPITVSSQRMKTAKLGKVLLISNHQWLNNLLERSQLDFDTLMHHSELNEQNLQQYSTIICDQSPAPLFPEKAPVTLFIKQDSDLLTLQHDELAPPLTSLTLLDKLGALHNSTDELQVPTTESNSENDSHILYQELINLCENNNIEVIDKVEQLLDAPSFKKRTTQTQQQLKQLQQFLQAFEFELAIKLLKKLM